MSCNKINVTNDAQAKRYNFIQYNYSMFYVIYLYTERFIIRHCFFYVKTTSCDCKLR